MCTCTCEASSSYVALSHWLRRQRADASPTARVIESLCSRGYTSRAEACSETCDVTRCVWLPQEDVRNLGEGKGGGDVHQRLEAKVDRFQWETQVGGW